MIHGLKKWVSLESEDEEILDETPEAEIEEPQSDSEESSEAPESDVEDSNEEEIEFQNEDVGDTDDSEEVEVESEEPDISTKTEEPELPEQFVTIEPLSEDDAVLAVVGVVEDIDSLESIKEILQDSPKISVQTLKFLKPTLESFQAKYNLKGSRLSLEEFSVPTEHSPRDAVEQVSVGPILDQVDKLQNELILNKAERIGSMLNTIKNFIGRLRYEANKIKAVATDIRHDANKQAFLDKPRNTTITVPVMTGTRSDEVLERKYGADHIGRVAMELEERLSILEIATECIYVEDPSAYLPNEDNVTIAFEDHEDSVNRDRTLQTFEVANLQVILKQLDYLSNIDYGNIFERISTQLQRIQTNILRVENPKDLCILNQVILKLSNGRYFRQPLIKLENELIEVCDMLNVARTELMEYIKSPENISIETLVDAPVNYWPTSEINFFNDKYHDGSWKFDKWVKDVHVSGTPVDMVNIVGLKNRYESLLTLVTHNILSDQRSPQAEELKKLVERLKGCIGSIDMDNLEDSLRENIRYLMDFKLDNLPKMPTVTNIPMVIEQTTLAPLSEGEFSKMLECTTNVIYHVKFYLESITDYDLAEYLCNFNGNEVKCEFNIDLFGEHKENPLVVQYVALINKHVNGLINGILVQRQDFLKQVGVLLQGIRTYLESQIRNA